MFNSKLIDTQRVVGTRIFASEILTVEQNIMENA